MSSSREAAYSFSPLPRVPLGVFIYAPTRQKSKCKFHVISCPPPFWRTDARSISTSITKAFLHARSRRPHAIGRGLEVLRHQSALRPHAASQRQSPTRTSILAGPSAPLLRKRKNSELAEANRHIDALRPHHNTCASKNHRETRFSSASIPPDITPSWPITQTPNKNPSSS